MLQKLARMRPTPSLKIFSLLLMKLLAVQSLSSATILKISRLRGVIPLILRRSRAQFQISSFRPRFSFVPSGSSIGIRLYRLHTNLQLACQHFPNGSQTLNTTSSTNFKISIKRNKSLLLSSQATRHPRSLLEMMTKAYIAYAGAHLMVYDPFIPIQPRIRFRSSTAFDAVRQL